MSVKPIYEQDSQFLRLVRREPDVDLVVAALEIARDGQPGLDFGPTLKTLKTAVANLTRPIAMAGSDLNELKLLIEYATEELHLVGDEECYDGPESSYLNCVLESGRGLPITLSIVYMAIANELGIPLKGVAAPSHFITQLDTDHELVFVDPFRAGLIMNEPECLAWLYGVTEMPVADLKPRLKAVDERTIIIRMLNNLKSLFGNREQWFDAWRVQNRLSLLMPGSYRERRDLAILTLRAGRAGEAIGQLEACIDVCSPEERPLLKQALRDAQKQAPLFN